MPRSMPEKVIVPQHTTLCEFKGRIYKYFCIGTYKETKLLAPAYGGCKSTLVQQMAIAKHIVEPHSQELSPAQRDTILSLLDKLTC